MYGMNVIGGLWRTQAHFSSTQSTPGPTSGWQGFGQSETGAYWVSQLLVCQQGTTHVQHIHHCRLYCGIVQAVYAESIRECGEALQLYNIGKTAAQKSYAFSFKRVYNQCFLRGGPIGTGLPNSACNDATGNPDRSFKELQAVSAVVLNP